MASLGHGNHTRGMYSVGMPPNWDFLQLFIAYMVKQFDVLWHDGYSLSVDGVEVGWHHFWICTTDTALIFVFCHCRYCKATWVSSGMVVTHLAWMV